MKFRAVGHRQRLQNSLPAPFSLESQTQTRPGSGGPQAAGDFQEQGRRLGRQFDDQGEQLRQRVSRRCAGFCAGCWRILRLAARIRWLLDSPWGYRNTCTLRDLRGVQVFLFPVITPSLSSTGRCES